MRRRGRFGMSAFTVGLIAVGLAAALTYLNFTKNIPFTTAYQVHAVFESANDISPRSPVRIAGVDVGEVTSIEHVSQDGRGLEQAVVTMKVNDNGRPIRRDATMKIRPRLFLEGNFFIDLQPGTPGAPELEDGDTIPINQTDHPVQIDQLLTSLQRDTREDLQAVLRNVGEALVDEGGAEGWRAAQRPAAEAFRESSRVFEAFRGREPRDLSNLVRNVGTVTGALARNEEALKSLVTNFNRVAGAIAAEDQALAQAINELPRVLEAATPAFDGLNRNFPDIRAFAREALPGVRSTPPTLRAAQPFVAQAARLFAEPELGGLSRELLRLVPELARLAEGSPKLFGETRALSACFNNVIIPWSQSTVPDSFFEPAGRIYEETAYGLAGIAGESRNFDGNGPYIRTHGAGGAATFAIGPDLGNSLFQLQGIQPSKNRVAKPHFNHDGKCEDQDPPDLRTGGPQPPPPPASSGSGSSGAGLRSVSDGEGESQPGREVLRSVSRRAAELYKDHLNSETLRTLGRGDEADELERSVHRRMRDYLRNDHPRVVEALSPLMSRDARRQTREQRSGLLSDLRTAARLQREEDER